MQKIKIKTIKYIGQKRVINLNVHKNHTIISKNGLITHNCDRLSSNAQDGLKGVIDKSSEFCRFIFTTNNYHKIIDPLKSRFQKEFDFGSNEKTKKEMIMGFFNKMKEILKSENIVDYDEKIIFELVVLKFPDFRKIINDIQSYYIIHGKIDTGISLYSNNLDKFNTLIEAMKKMDYKKIRSIVSEIESNHFYNIFYQSIDKLILDESKIDSIILLAHYGYQNNNCIDKEINLAACVFELSKKIKWR